MKKIALVLAVLLIVGGAAFAEVGVYVGGQAQTALNMDLDVAGSYALTNSLFAKIVVSFGEAIERSGDGDVYGEIEVSNLGLSQVYIISTGDYVTQAIAAPAAVSGGHWAEDPVWTAKIIAGDFYFKVDGGEYMRARRDVMANVLDDFSLVGMDSYGAFPSSTLAATAAVGGMLEGVGDFVLKFGTESATPIASNAFGVAVDFSLTAVDDLGVDLSFVYDNTAATVMGVGATAGYDVMVDAFTVTPYGAIDYDLTASTFEAGGGVKVGWDSDKGGVVSDGGDNAWKQFFGAKTYVSPGLDVAVKYGTQMDLKVSGAYFPVDDLNSAVLFEIADLAGASTMGVGAYADYTGVADVKLFGWFHYTTVLDLVLGAEYTAFDNTTLGVQYTNMATAGDVSGYISAYAKVSAW